MWKQRTQYYTRRQSQKKSAIVLGKYSRETRKSVILSGIESAMALLFTNASFTLFSKFPNKSIPSHSLLSQNSPSSLTLLSFPSISNTKTRPLNLPSFRPASSSSSGNDTDPASGSGPSKSIKKAVGDRARVTDEWGEEAEPEPESSLTKLSDSDPPKDEDEWEEDGHVKIRNGSPANVGTETGKSLNERLRELKRSLVDTVDGTELGFRAGVEVRAEVLELVSQLEAANPTPASIEAPELLDGNWVLLYTAYSELLPLLAAGSLPLLKVDKISQAIDSNSLTIVNAITLSSPFATLSFSASANFEVLSPSRIQVQFKEGTFQPPEIKSSVDLPEKVQVFGRTINLSLLQRTLNLVQEYVASITRFISGQPPLKLPIPGERTKSWLLISYLDKDLRISRGDGGLFVLAREGTPLLYQ